MNRGTGMFGGSSARSLSVSIATVIAVAGSIAGCNGRSVNEALTNDAECSVRVIVRLAVEGDDGLLVDLERANGVELEPVGQITSGLRVFTLRAAGSAGDCVAAIDRLRRDERVRSIDFDTRRELHQEPRNPDGEG